MATRETFGKICKRVCEQQGWGLLPSGVQVEWGDGRHQLVSLEFFEFGREELVRLHTIIGQSDQLTPERMLLALTNNSRLVHGALAVRDHHLVMVDTLMLKDAGAAEVEASIAYLSETADHFEKLLFGTDDH